jgi:hypothetical protein
MVGGPNAYRGVIATLEASGASAMVDDDFARDVEEAVKL